MDCSNSTLCRDYSSQFSKQQALGWLQVPLNTRWRKHLVVHASSEDLQRGVHVAVGRGSFDRSRQLEGRLCRQEKHVSLLHAKGALRIFLALSGEADSILNEDDRGPRDERELVRGALRDLDAVDLKLFERGYVPPGVAVDRLSPEDLRLSLQTN